MGVPTSEVGYTIATTRRETTKVHKNMWWHWAGGEEKNCGSVSTCSSRSAQTFIRSPRCCSVRFLGTHFFHSQFFSQYPTNGFPVHANFISNHFDCLSSIGSNTSLTPAVLTSVLVADGRPLRCLSPTTFLPSENILCQRKARAPDTSSSPKAF